MKNVGVKFEVPNKYGSYLYDILEPIPGNSFKWLIDNDEIHLVHDDDLTGEFLFNNDDEILSWEKLYGSSKNNMYYMVFVTLRAFLKDGVIKGVSEYKDFLESDCQIMLAVYDCSYVIYWCKDSQLVSSIYEYALSKCYENVKYISEEHLIANKCWIE